MPEKELDYEYPNMLKFVLAREGGYSNNKDDLGGETNKGITHTTYDSYRRSKGLPTIDVKNISKTLCIGFLTNILTMLFCVVISYIFFTIF